MRIRSGDTTRKQSFYAQVSETDPTPVTGLTTVRAAFRLNDDTVSVVAAMAVSEKDAANEPGHYTFTVDRKTTLSGSVDDAQQSIHLSQTGMASILLTNDVYRLKATEGQTINVGGTTSGAVDTVTANEDMRGTDNAATASALAITDAVCDAILLDTGTTIPGLIGVPAVDLAADIAAVPTATENADALLDRDLGAVTETNARSPLNAFRFLRNKWEIVGSILTVYEEDDTTVSWTATLSSSASADNVTGVDP